MEVELLLEVEFLLVEVELLLEVEYLLMVQRHMRSGGTRQASTWKSQMIGAAPSRGVLAIITPSRASSVRRGGGFARLLL